MGEIKIVGTAHVSAKSVDEVRESIEQFHPDIVAVELDQGRSKAINKEGATPSVDDVLELKNFDQLLIQWLLSYIQRKIGLDVGVEPGAEMKAAMVEAQQRGLRVELVDRDIKITLLRFWQSLGFIGKIKMVGSLIFSIAEVENIDAEEIEKLKNEDMLEVIMGEFKKFSPQGAHALIDERDAYIAHNLIDLKNEADHRILAVVGAGHMQGINRYLQDPSLLPSKESLVKEPKRYPWTLIIGSCVTALFFLLLASIACSGVGLDVLLHAFIFWVLIHGALSAGATLAVRGHPYSVITCFCVAWMTSLNPLLHAGWIAAYVEAKARKPPVSDFRKIYEATSLTELFQIPLFKVVLVASVANLGSFLGTILYFMFLFPVLGVDPVVVISTGLHNIQAAIAGIL
jgi:pheromone shutdown-related protein TraB